MTILMSILEVCCKQALHTEGGDSTTKSSEGSIGSSEILHYMFKVKTNFQLSLLLSARLLVKSRTNDCVPLFEN